LEEVGGYEIIIKNKCCFIYYNSILYAHCPLVNELYVLNIDDKSVCNINVKRAQLNDLNPTFIWHCRLGHINKKRIERLHKDGLLSSFNFESFDTCKSCLLQKMTKATFTGQSERASDLLGLVHKDGLLSSFNFESFDTCESCLLEKMTKVPFTGQSERGVTCWYLYILMSVDQ
jgi:hypothetical protein